MSNLAPYHRPQFLHMYLNPQWQWLHHSLSSQCSTSTPLCQPVTAGLPDFLLQSSEDHVTAHRGILISWSLQSSCHSDNVECFHSCSVWCICVSTWLPVPCVAVCFCTLDTIILHVQHMCDCDCRCWAHDKCQRGTVIQFLHLADYCCQQLTVKCLSSLGACFFGLFRIKL